MKMVKAILLGSATAMVSTFASAADLPRKAAPAEFVQVCQGQGAGFFVIPGTTTCLRIGGFVRMDAVYGENTAAPGPVGTSHLANNYGTTVRNVVNFDARSATSMGTLRSVAEFQVRRGTATSSSPDALIGSGNGQYNRSSLASLNAAFIQFAGFTAGFAPSPFAFGGYNGSLAIVANQVSGGYLPAGVASAQLAYTASFGGGFSATLALVDAMYTRNGALATIAAATPGVITAASTLDGIVYGGNQVPDVVGRLNFTSALGAVQVMGALHQLKSGTAAVGDSYGYAVGAGLSANLPFIGAGSALWVQAVYAEGANVYAFDNGNSDGLAVDRQTIGTKAAVGRYSDAVFNAAGTGYDKTKTFAVHGGLRGQFSPMVGAGLFAGYLNIDAPSNSVNRLSDIKLFNVGANVTYTPVQNLNLSLEAVYYDAKVTSTVVGSPQVGANTYALGLRIQRNF